MGSVYSSSACAFIWLGPGDEDCDQAMSFIDSLEYITSERREPLDEDDSWLHNLLDAAFQRLDEQTLAELSALFLRPWFHRSWTLQEPIRAPNSIIACGSIIHSFTSFFFASLACTHWCFRHAEWTVFDVSSFYLTFGFVTAMPEELCLSTLLFRTSLDREASDPRDKVYALYGLVQGYQKVPLTVSYAMSVEDLYRSTVRFCIENEESLSILKPVPTFKNQSDLPSWVPDWRDQSGSGCEPMSWLKLAGFHASSMSRPLLVPSSSNDKLILKGFTLARVERTIKITALGVNLADSSPDSWRTHAAAAGVPVRFLQGRRFQTSYDHTTTMEKSPFHSSMNQYVAKAIWPNSTRWFSAGCPDPVPQAVLTEYKEHFDHQTHNRCLFLTKDSLGLAPAPTQVGDRVCILLGGDAPFILRPRQNTARTTPSKEAKPKRKSTPKTTLQGITKSRNQGPRKSTRVAKQALEATEWSLIGDCYLHGYMQGEAMETVTEADYMNFTLV